MQHTYLTHTFSSRLTDVFNNDVSYHSRRFVRARSRMLINGAMATASTSSLLLLHSAQIFSFPSTFVNMFPCVSPDPTSARNRVSCVIPPSTAAPTRHHSQRGTSSPEGTRTTDRQTDRRSMSPAARGREGARAGEEKEGDRENIGGGGGYIAVHSPRSLGMDPARPR